MPDKFVSVVGARPQFVKLAPICSAAAAAGDISHRVIHTGQHYDEQMSASFFELLNISEPDVNLAVGSGRHGEQTGRMLAALEQCFLEDQPDVVLVYGDTNSTLAAALAAVKQHIPVVHIEAGLRSYNRAMPEEINRIVADHTCDRLYAPTPGAVDILRTEQLAERTCFSGDVMRDSVEHFRTMAAEQAGVLRDNDLDASGYALLTLHRPVNTTPDALAALLPALDQLARDLPVVFPVHPRTRAVIDSMPGFKPQALSMLPPLNYLDMLYAVENARFVMTDSGGLQKECAFLETRCMTLRDETEWTELTELGINRLVGTDLELLRQTFEHYCRETQLFDTATQAELDRCYGNGNAAGIIIRDLQAWLAAD